MEKNKIRKKDLIKELQYELATTPQSAEDGINCIFEKIKSSLKEEDYIEIEGLGRLYVLSEDETKNS